MISCTPIADDAEILLHLLVLAIVRMIHNQLIPLYNPLTLKVRENCVLSPMWTYT